MLLCVVLYVFCFLTYFLGVSTSVYGGDSGDVILASWFGGVAHPPGYPLQTMLGWIFTHLPYSAPVAYKANLMAVFLQAFVVVITFLICKKLTKSTLASLAASLTLAFTALFWLYAHIIEVFQLNLVLTAVCIYFLVCWRESALLKRPKTVFLYLTALFWGLAIFHHHTSVLLAPAIVYLVIKTDKTIFVNKRLLFKLFLLGCLGSLPYIFIPFAVFRHTPINWDDPSNLKNFIRLITRADYGTFTAATFLVASTIKLRLIHVADYILFLKSDFAWIALGIIVGAFYAFLKARDVFWFILLAALFLGPFFLFYSSFPLSSDFYTGLWERFILVSYFILTLYLAYGFLWAFEFIDKSIKKKFKLVLLRKDSFALLIKLLLFFVPFYFLFANFPKTDLSKFKLGDWFGHDLLVSAEPNAIIFLVGDTAIFNGQYYYYTNPDKRNIKLIKAGSLSYLYYRQQVARDFKNLTLPEKFLDEKGDGQGFIQQLIVANMDKYPIYIRDYQPDVENHRWIPVGLLTKLVPSEKEISGSELALLNKSRFDQFYYRDFEISNGYTQFMFTHIKDQYYSSLIPLANQLFQLNNYEDATYYLDKATVLMPEKKDAYEGLGSIFFVKKDCDRAKANFEKMYQIDQKDFQALLALSNLYSRCYENKEQADIYKKQADDLRKKLEGGLN